MMSATTPCYPNVSQGLPIYGVSNDNVVSCSPEGISGSETFPNSLLLSLSLLKEKVHQVQSMVNIFLSPHLNQNSESTSIAVASMNTLIQEIIFTASSIKSSCQQMAMVIGSTPSITKFDDLGERGKGLGLEFHTGETLEYWYGNNNSNTCNMNSDFFNINLSNNNDNSRGFSPKNDDIIELDAAYLLAKYTHYCQVCGKGFKRAANLRMHMRAHGDEYKSSAALSNPKKNESEIGQKDSHAIKMPKKYSCPQEGCRWNRKHDKFQPLKSIICVKNHYKRSHCAKLYVCKRCNRKQFSVLSDLRTHEKHCGVVKWQCSCGTTFSRKDKLMGHVALFVGHTPAVNSLKKNGTS